MCVRACVWSVCVCVCLSVYVPLYVCVCERERQNHTEVETQRNRLYFLLSIRNWCFAHPQKLSVCIPDEINKERRGKFRGVN